MRYYDGTQWTQHTQPVTLTPQPTKTVDPDPNAPLYEFVSHQKGINPTVRIYPGIIEWERTRKGSGGKIAAKITAGVLTAGVSLLATGVGGGGKSASESIPIKNVTSVKTARDGMTYTVVKVSTMDGNTIDFRTTHAEAEQARKVISNLIVGANQQNVTVNVSQSAVQAPMPQMIVTTPASQADPMQQLTQLKGLLDAGVLTQEEFDAQKTRLLGQL